MNVRSQLPPWVAQCSLHSFLLLKLQSLALHCLLVQCTALILAEQDGAYVHSHSLAELEGGILGYTPTHSKEICGHSQQHQLQNMRELPDIERFCKHFENYLLTYLLLHIIVVVWNFFSVFSTLCCSLLYVCTKNRHFLSKSAFGKQPFSTLDKL